MSNCNRLINKVTFVVIMISFFGNVMRLNADEIPEPTSGNNFADLIWSALGLLVPTLIFIVIGMIIYTSVKKRKQISQTDPSENSELPTFNVPFSYNRDLADLGNSAETDPDQTSTSQTENGSHEQNALDELERIRNSSQPLRSQYQRTAEIVKNYLTEKYNAKVIDLSTSELLENLPNSESDLISDYVGEILRGCGMIEFRRYRPNRSDFKQIYETTKSFLESQLGRSENADQ